MDKPRRDLSIYGKLDLEKPAVGVKFLPNRPKGVEQLDKTMALCAMIGEAQERGAPFYVSKENEDCVGGLPMGWMDVPPMAESGAMGSKWGIFEEARANAKLYVGTPKFSRDVFRYVVFSPLDNMTFDPDLLFILATPSQAEIVFRAMLYRDGGLIESVTSNVLACAYLFPYPYFSGKVNYIPTGVAFGAKGRQTFPEGRLLITIPWNWTSRIAENLADMEWVLPAYTMGPEKFLETAARYHEEVRTEFEEE
ncbi:MAG: DUF169 domain-containing protein [Actinobacteria bacterium]|jgi:uncharacterized protein (DUF169 family)|nr:DUF169 domain-containing protein [Actinomycetota bacterium]